MYLLPAVVGLLALDIASALELPAIFRSRKRQNVDDITVNLPNEAADAFKTFFSDKTTFSTCPESMGGPPPESTDTKPTKRQDVGGAIFACYYGIGKVATSLVTDGRALSSLYKASKEILINHEEPPTYQDPKVQEAFAAHLLAGAKMLEQNYPGINSGTSNRILGAIFLASHATIVAKATYYGYYGVSRDYLKDNGGTGHCLETQGRPIDCTNPFCQGRSSGACAQHTAFFGCPCTPFVCPDGDDIPYCEDCGGDNGGSHCKGYPEDGRYENCACLNSQNPPPFIYDQHGFVNIGPLVDKLPDNNGDGSEPTPSNPSCKGIDSGKWVARDPAMDAAENDFCKDPKRLKSEGASDDDLKNGRINSDAWYNHDSKDDMHLKITWYQNGEISEKDCVDFFRSIIDGCDKDDPKNPGNVKHGGSWTHQPEGSSSKVAVLELNPSDGKYRNDCISLDSDKWMADAALSVAIEDFCPQAFDNKDERFEKKYNEGGPNEVILIADWAQDQRDEFTCHEALRLLKDDCGSTTLKHGPLGGTDGPGNFKHGGYSVPHGRAIFAAWPQRSALCASQPDYGCGSDNDCNDIWCPSGTDWYTGRCIEGKCGCAIGGEGRICTGAHW